MRVIPCKAAVAPVALPSRSWRAKVDWWGGGRGAECSAGSVVGLSGDSLAAMGAESAPVSPEWESKGGGWDLVGQVKENHRQGFIRTGRQTTCEKKDFHMRLIPRGILYFQIMQALRMIKCLKTQMHTHSLTHTHTHSLSVSVPHSHDTLSHTQDYLGQLKLPTQTFWLPKYIGKLNISLCKTDFLRSFCQR